jgi:hypothetical protein
VRQKLAGAVVELAFRGADARADVDHLALGLHRTGLVGHGAHVVHLDLDRGVADAGLERGVDAAAHHRIEQGGGNAAMHGAERIIVVIDRRVVEDDAAELDLRHPETQRLADRRRRKTAFQQALEQGEPVHGAGLLEGHHAVTRIAHHRLRHRVCVHIHIRAWPSQAPGLKSLPCPALACRPSTAPAFASAARRGA